VVRAGEASLDMASLTGESVPVDVDVGDPALPGSINTNGRLEIEVTRLGAETTLGKIIALMRTAGRAKRPVSRLLERYAGHYMALVLLIAAGTWFASNDTAATLAVLVASCPCALVLAAPATAIAAISVAARHGILIKGAAFLEQLAEVTSVIFDKTGTLTTGQLTLVEFRTAPGVETGTALSLASALGAASSHPVSRAVSRAASASNRPVLDHVREMSGFGVTATAQGVAVALDRPDLFGALHVEAPPAHDGPIAGLSHDGVFQGWLLFADRSRPESRAAVDELRALGLERQTLLTGDRQAVARRIGAELGIAEVCAEALPEQKMDRVLTEIAAGFRPLVVGDGINDSLALKVGAVGVAFVHARPRSAPHRTSGSIRACEAPAPSRPRHLGRRTPGDLRRTGRPVVVAEGSRLGPFTVTAIGPGAVELAGPAGVRTLRPSSDADLRSQSASKGPIMAWIDPVRREVETESDQ